MHIKIIQFSLLLSALIVVHGCASLSKSECNQGDWAKIGNKDAQRGLLAEKQLKKHRSACAQYQKVPNKAIYDSGYQQGLKQFCVNRKGYKHGSKGSEYHENCPANLERDFLTGYIPGLESALNSLEDDLEDLRFDRSKLERKLDKLYYLQRKNKKHKKRVKSLESRLDSIQSNMYSKRNEISQLRSWRSRWLYKLDQ